MIRVFTQGPQVTLPAKLARELLKRGFGMAFDPGKGMPTGWVAVEVDELLSTSLQRAKPAA